jgi:hypothetical protein
MVRIPQDLGPLSAQARVRGYDLRISRAGLFPELRPRSAETNRSPTGRLEVEGIGNCCEFRLELPGEGFEGQHPGLQRAQPYFKPRRLRLCRAGSDLPHHDVTALLRRH